jgi:hypothetical protein
MNNVPVFNMTMRHQPFGGIATLQRLTSDMILRCREQQEARHANLRRNPPSGTTGRG